MWPRQLVGASPTSHPILGKGGDQMTLLIMAVILALIGLLIVRVAGYSDLLEFIGVGFIAIGAIATVVWLIATPLSYSTTKGRIAQFEALRHTVEVARRDDSMAKVMENVMLQQEIVKGNCWLADTKYWNTTVFDIAIPDEIEDLKPIE